MNNERGKKPSEVRYMKKGNCTATATGDGSFFENVKEGEKVTK